MAAEKEAHPSILNLISQDMFQRRCHSVLWAIQPYGKSRISFRTNVPCGCSKSAHPRPDCGRLGGGPWAMARWRWRSWYPTDGLDETGQGSSPCHTLLEALSGVFSRRLSVRHVMSSTSLAAAASGSLPTPSNPSHSSRSPPARAL